jgi:hypothetical protein
MTRFSLGGARRKKFSQNLNRISNILESAFVTYPIFCGLDSLIVRAP